MLKIVRGTRVIEEKRNLRMYLKNGGDGAGTMPVLKSKHCADDVDHIFQYGIIPLKLTAASDTTEEEILWSNSVPNSARSLRPVYLIREIETEETDEARKYLNTNGTMIDDICVSVNINDSMKDLKFKRYISGLGGTAYILCKSKVEDWTCLEKIYNGFPIDRTDAGTLQIFNSVADQHGHIVVKPGDFNTRFGVIKEAISDSDQHCCTAATHSGMGREEDNPWRIHSKSQGLCKRNNQEGNRIKP